jgi:uncharacterized protein YbbK (DUF523 family)
VSFVACCCQPSCRYDGTDDPSNSILQRALINYVNTTCTELIVGLPTAEYTLKRKPKVGVEILVSLLGCMMRSVEHC